MPVEPKAIDPKRVSLSDAADLLSKASGLAITVAMIEADVAAGCPTNPDGSINLLHYTAWQLHTREHGAF